MDTQREPEFHPEERKSPTSLADFAQQNQITEERVWEMIEEGTVAARFVNDSILIMKGGEPAIDLSYHLPGVSVREEPAQHGRVGAQPSFDGLLEPLPLKPSAKASTPQRKPADEKHRVDLRGERDLETEKDHPAFHAEPDVERDFDHRTVREVAAERSFAEEAADERGFGGEVSMKYRSFAEAVREAEEMEARMEVEMRSTRTAAKELQQIEAERRGNGEYFPDAETSESNAREILLFAQDALARNESLSRQLLSTKDELLRMKDERIHFLEHLMQQKDKEIRTLSRQVEELVTLKKFESL